MEKKKIKQKKKKTKENTKKLFLTLTAESMVWRSWPEPLKCVTLIHAKGLKMTRVCVCVCVCV